jgi:hypothetical protein
LSRENPTLQPPPCADEPAAWPELDATAPEPIVGIGAAWLEVDDEQAAARRLPATPTTASAAADLVRRPLNATCLPIELAPILKASVKRKAWSPKSQAIR